jgi:hypothetical protein
MNIDIIKYYIYYKKWRWVSPSTTSATQNAAALPTTNSIQVRHQSQPNAIYTIPTQGGYYQTRRNEGDITKFKACHAKLGGGTGNQIQMHPIAPKRATRASPVPWQPRLLKWRSMSPSATFATQNWIVLPATKRAPARHQSQPNAISATHATQNEGGVACERWCVTKWCMIELCVKDGVC